MATTKDCKEAIATWLQKTHDANCYFNGYDSNIKRIWKRNSGDGKIIRAFRDSLSDSRLLYVIEENGNLTVKPNHPDVVWTFSFDEDMQDDRDVGQVVFEIHPENEELANSYGYYYGALEYLFDIFPADASEIMENCVSFSGTQDDIEQLLLSVGLKHDSDV